MKLSTNRVGAFLRAPDPKSRFVLIYGEDRGLVRARAIQLARTVVTDLNDPFKVSELGVDDLRGDSARLADELSQMSLLGGRRVIFLRIEAEDISARLAPVLEDAPPGDNLLIVEAGELTPRSPVRKLFETLDTAVAIACYGDGAEQIEALIEATFKPTKTTVEPAARDFLLAHLGADHMVTRSELEKLALYVRGRPTVTVDDVIASVGDSAALSLDHVAFAAAEGDGPSLDQHLARAFREGEGPIGVLRSVLRHFHRLQLAASYIEHGRSLDDAMKALRPPVMFLYEGNVRKQLRQWNGARLRMALSVLAEAERDCKSTGMPDEAVTHRALMRICLAARRSATSSSR